MNYIELINLFWTRYEECELSASEAVLYFHLLDICNKCNWSNPFKRRNTVVCAQLRMSKSTFLRCREALAGAALIKFESTGKGDNNITYHLILPGQKNQKKSKNYTSVETTIGATVGASVETTIDAHNKNINNKHKHKQLEVEEVSTREEEIEQAISDFCTPEEPVISEKEKSSAKKEKELPPMSGAMARISTTAHWRNAAEHHKISAEDREKLFKIFYEQKEDNYRIRYPTPTDMAQNFYYWIASLKKLNKINDFLHGDDQQQTDTKHKNTVSRRASASDKRAELLDLSERSAEFLRVSND